MAGLPIRVKPPPTTPPTSTRRIFDLWMACHAQEEIAERESVTKETISAICQKMAELPKSDKPAADHLTDFDPPIYSVHLLLGQAAR
jgi:hypothetical protein